MPINAGCNVAVINAKKKTLTHLFQCTVIHQYFDVFDRTYEKEKEVE